MCRGGDQDSTTLRESNFMIRGFPGVLGTSADIYEAYNDSVRSKEAYNESMRSKEA